MSKYPEHEKLTVIAKESQMIGEFLEWLSMEKGISLGNMQTYEFEGLEGTYPKTEFLPWRGQNDELLAAFFDIDRQKLDDEKSQMLKAIRETG